MRYVRGVSCAQIAHIDEKICDNSNDSSECTHQSKRTLKQKNFTKKVTGEGFEVIFWTDKNYQMSNYLKLRTTLIQKLQKQNQDNKRSLISKQQNQRILSY